MLSVSTAQPHTCWLEQLGEGENRGAHIAHKELCDEATAKALFEHHRNGSSPNDLHVRTRIGCHLLRRLGQREGFPEPEGANVYGRSGVEHGIHRIVMHSVALPKRDCK